MCGENFGPLRMPMNRAFWEGLKKRLLSSSLDLDQTGKFSRQIRGFYGRKTLKNTNVLGYLGLSFFINCIFVHRGVPKNET
ncbi:hypothetical protein PORCAN_580 [Porphyromonas crevioricanis JCM 13913]|nr:hypothetical protein PORCAN_580 [Porphyromonas crevioricanis JCM 13913]